jgi:hypothetical protein
VPAAAAAVGDGGLKLSGLAAMVSVF